MTQSIRDVRDESMHVPIENGKYSFVVREDGSCALFRHGQPWIEEPQGAKALIAAFAELRESRRAKPLDLAVQASIYADAAMWLNHISSAEAKQLDLAASLLKRRAEQCREVHEERRRNRAGIQRGRFESPPGPDRVRELEHALQQIEEELTVKKYIFDRRSGSTHVQLWTRYCKHTASVDFEHRSWRCFSVGERVDRQLVSATDALRTAIAVLDMSLCVEARPDGEKEAQFGVRYGAEPETVSSVLKGAEPAPCVLRANSEQAPAIACAYCGKSIDFREQEVYLNGAKTSYVCRAHAGT